MATISVTISGGKRQFNRGDFMRKCLFMGFLFLVGGCGMPSILLTPVSNTSELQEIKVKAPGEPSNGGGGKIAIVGVEGTLMNARSGGFLQAEENPLSLFVQELDQAASDDSVKAVVLRVNSPGGTVTCSDTMYEALQRFRKKTHKPVVASAQEL